MADPKIRFDIEANATGAAEVDRLAQTFTKLDDAVDPALAARAEAAARALREIGEQQAAIGAFDRLQAETEGAAHGVAAAGEALDKLRAKLEGVAEPTAAQSGRLQKLEDTLQRSKTALEAKSTALGEARGKLDAFGVPLDRVASKQAELRDQLQATRQEVQALGQTATSAQGFERLASSTEDARVAVARTRAELDAYAAKLAGLDEISNEQAHALQSLGAAAAKAEADFARASAAQAAAAQQTRAAGVDIDAVTASQQRARAATLATAEASRTAAAAQLSAAQSAAEAARSQSSAIASGTRQYTALVSATEDARIAVLRTDTELERYRATLVAGEAPTRAQAQALGQLSAAANRAQVGFLEAASAQARATGEMRAAGVDVEGIASAQQRARAATLATAEAANRAANAARQQGDAGADAAQRQAAGAQQVVHGLNDVSSSLRNLQGLVGSVLGGQLLAGQVGDVLRTADAYLNLAARVKLVTGEGAAFDQAFQGVIATAKASSTALESTGTLFTRIAQAGEQLKLSSQQALQVTETINKAIQVSGAGAEAADAAVTQLIQGLQSGVLRGEEFNSMMEQAPRLAKALADGIGVPITQLRALSEQGQLTSQTVIQALRSQSDTISREFSTLPATVGRAITNLQTQWTEFVGRASQNNGATQAIAESINALARHLDEVAAVATRAGAVITAALAVQAVNAMRSFIAAGKLAELQAMALSTQLGAIPKMVSITVAVAGFEVGFKIGEMLRENSALARQLGVAVSGFVQAIISDMQLLEESAKAVFTDDTIGAAVDRYKKRAEELDESFQVLWKAAEEAPGKVGAAADQAAASTGGLGGAAQQASAQVVAGGQAASSALQGTAAQGETAVAALQAIGKAAGLSLPAAGASAQTLAGALLEVVQKGGTAAQVFDRDLLEAIGKLSGSELMAFLAASTQSLQQMQHEAQRTAEGLAAVGKPAEQSYAQAEAAAQRLQQVTAAVGTQAAKSLGVDMAGLAVGVSREFLAAQDNLGTLVRSLPSLQRAGVDTGAAVAAALSGMISKAGNQAELDALSARIRALGNAGVIGSAAVTGSLRLIGERANEVRDKIEASIPGIQSLREAAKAAGVDFGSLTTGISKGFSDSSTNIQALATQIGAAGVKAQTAGPVLAQALNQQVAAAKTEQEARAIVTQIEAIIAKSPQLTASLGGALEEARVKAAELNPEMQRAHTAAEKLGVSIKRSVGNAAESAIKDYETLKASGIASAEELQSAFGTMAQRVMKTNGGITSDWLKVEAGLRNVEILSEKTGVSFKNLGSQLSDTGAGGVQAGNHIALSFGRIGDSIRQAGNEIDVFDTKQRNAAVTAESAASDAARKAMNAQGVDATGMFRLREKLDSGMLTAADADLVKGVADAAKQNAAMSKGANPSALSQEFWRSLQEQTAIAQRAQEMLAGLGAAPGQVAGFGAPLKKSESSQSPAPAPALSPAPAPAAQTRTTVVNLALPGGGTHTETIHTTDQQSADALLNVLEQAARSLGR